MPERSAPLWRSPALAFTCGACGTTVTGLVYTSDVLNVMRTHDQFCKGFAPSDHESGDDRACESSAADAGVTPGDSSRVAVAGGSGRGE